MNELEPAEKEAARRSLPDEAAPVASASASAPAETGAGLCGRN